MLTLLCSVSLSCAGRTDDEFSGRTAVLRLAFAAVSPASHCVQLRQDDCHVPNLTVYETLFFALRLRQEHTAARSVVETELVDAV